MTDRLAAALKALDRCLNEQGDAPTIEMNCTWLRYLHDLVIERGVMVGEKDAVRRFVDELNARLWECRDAGFVDQRQWEVHEAVQQIVNELASQEALDLIEIARGVTVGEDAPLTCGITHPDANVESLIDTARYPEPTEGFNGCGKVLGGWQYRHRCADCGRWMHRECLYRHFAEHASDTDAARRFVEGLTDKEADAAFKSMCEGSGSITQSLLPFEKWIEHIGARVRGAFSEVLASRGGAEAPHD